MARIGIYGGSFNPVHKGHILCAEYLIKKNILDKIIFVPAYIPPLKESKDIIDSFHRVNMLKLAMERKKNFEISTAEIERKGISYTIDTVKFFIENNKKDSFFLILGTDLIKNFHLWKDYQKLSELVDFIVLKRPGSDVDWNELNLPEKIIEKFRNSVVETPNIPVSSSEIREKIKSKDNKFLKQYLNNKVYKYILDKKLYF